MKMNKKAVIFVLVLSLLFSVFSVSSFAAEKVGSVIPFEGDEEIAPVNPELEYGGEFDEVFELYEELFGEAGKAMLILVLAAFFFSSLFVPALVVMIVFIVLNRRARKEIDEYERIFVYYNVIDMKDQVFGNPNLSRVPPPVIINPCPIGGELKDEQQGGQNNESI